MKVHLLDELYFQQFGKNDLLIQYDLMQHRNDKHSPKLTKLKKRFLKNLFQYIHYSLTVKLMK